MLSLYVPEPAEPVAETWGSGNQTLPSTSQSDGSCKNPLRNVSRFVAQIRSSWH